MNIELTVKNLFIKIAKKLNLELVKKTDTKVRYSDNGLNPTAIGAAVIANIAIDDSDVIIDGDNARANAIREIKEYYADEIQTAVAEVSLGTGDAIVRPYTDGKHIGLNIIGNDNFIITENIGTYIKGVIMKLDEYEKNNKTYRLFESQSLKDNVSPTVIYIRRFAYENDKEIDLINTNWDNMSFEEVITAEQLLIGRYKCPTVNRENYNSANGVPITFGCEEIIENIKSKYKQYNDEFDRKQALIFADKSMFKTEKNESGAVKYKMDSTHFIKIRGNVDGGVKGMIEDYSPDIRETEFKEAINLNFAILELCCGFSRGIFTKPEISFATATEMINSLKKTFSFVKRFRKRISNGDKMLFNAINIIMNLNGTTPIGDWNIRHDWSYEYIESTVERFNQLLQGHIEGVVSDETLCAWINNLTEEEAQKYMAELRTVADKAKTNSEDDE